MNGDDYRSINIDSKPWKQAEILAIDKGVTTTEFIEEAVKEKIDKEKAHQIQA